MLKDGIASILNVFEALDTGRYLGMPSLVGRKKKQFSLFLERNCEREFKGGGKNSSIKLERKW